MVVLLYGQLQHWLYETCLQSEIELISTMTKTVGLHLLRSWYCVVVSTLRLLPLIAVLVCGAATAADDTHPLEASDTSSPRSTLQSFLAAMHDVYDMTIEEGRSYQSEAERITNRNRVFRCLDLSDLAPTARTSLATEAAVCLKEVLDRIELPPESEWPGLDEVAEMEIIKWTIPHTDISIVKVKTGLRTGEFLFSPATVDRAREFYDIVKGRQYINRDTATPGLAELLISEPGWMIPRGWIPSWGYPRWYGQAVWQWVGLVLTLLLAMVLMATIYLLGRWRARASRSSKVRYLVSLAFPIAAMLVPLATRYLIAEQLIIYGGLVIAIQFALQIVYLFALMIVVISVTNRLAELIIATPWIRPAGLDAQLVRLTCRFLGLAGAAIVLLEGGQQLGIPLTTLLAGASVSGLALALAAQDSLKNILGSMMIMLDKPFRVGERIVVKGYDGVVEDIGLRSTKLRLLTGHQVSIPNEELARTEIENIGRRPYIRRAATIELPSGTSAAKIKRALEILRGILEDHEGMAEEYPPHVFLRDVNKGSLGIFMIYWYHPPDYWDFLAFSERVTLQMSEQFETAGISFAAPVLNVYMPPAKQLREG
jgi:MscS family membrane protein